MRVRALAVILCLLLVGCGRNSGRPSASTSTSTPPSTEATTTTRLPTVTGQPIPGLDTAAFHGAFGKTGFTLAPPTSLPGFTTTTSKRADATISTYGKGPADVVSIVAEADRRAATSVLPAVVAAVAKGRDGRKADAWVRDALKRGPISASAPRSSSATFGAVPYELLVNAVTATLSIGRLNG